MPAEIIALLAVVRITGALFSTLAIVEPDEIYVFLSYHKVLEFTTITSLAGTVLIAFQAYILAYLSIYQSPRLRHFIILVLMCFFVLSYYSILQSILAWVGVNGIIESLTLGNVKLFKIADNSLASASVLTVSGYVWRYLPITYLFIFLSMSRLPSTTISAANNLGLKSIRIHIHLVLGVIWPSLVLVFVYLFFSLSLDDLSVSIFARGKYKTIGTMLTQADQAQTLRNIATYLALIHIVLSILTLLLMHSFLGKSINEIRSKFVFLLGNQNIPAPMAVLSIVVLYVGCFMISSGLILLSIGFSRSTSGFFHNSATLDGYLSIFSDEDLLSALKNSIVLASAVASIATIFGIISSWEEYRRCACNRPTRNLFWQIVLVLPLFIPAVTIARSAALIRGAYPEAALFDWITCIVLQVGLFVSIPVILISFSLSSIGSNCFRAAKNLGIEPWKIAICFLGSTRNTIIASWLSVFALSINEYSMTRYLFSSSEISRTPLSVLLDNRRISNLGPSEYAASSLLMIFTVILLSIGLALSTGILDLRLPRNRRRV